MELTNELKLLLIQTGPHTNAQAVIDNIENTVEIDTDKAWVSRLNKYIKDKQLGTWTGVSPDEVYTEPTIAELETSLLANPYVPVETASIWELEGHESEAAYTATEYARNRQSAYPPVADYLDAFVKDDTAAMAAYKDACLAVKTQYPKP